MTTSAAEPLTGMGGRLSILDKYLPVWIGAAMLGCGDACPVFPGKRYLDWKLDDPAGQDIEAIRDEIRARVEGLIAELLPGGIKGRTGEC